MNISQININCEGLTNSEDKLKLVNSCKLEYKLNTTTDAKYLKNNMYQTESTDFDFIPIFIICMLTMIVMIVIIVAMSDELNKNNLTYTSYRHPYVYNYPYTPFGTPIIIPQLINTPPIFSSNIFDRKNSSDFFKTSTSFGSTTTR